MTCLGRLLRGRRRSLHLVLDNLSAHKAQPVTAYVDDSQGKLTLHALLGYA